MAFKALYGNKVRSLLSITGISIGIFSIVLVYTLVFSLENNIKKSIDSLGKNVIYIDKWEWINSGHNYPWWKFLNRPDPSLNDMNQLSSHPVSSLFETISFSEKATKKIKSEKESVSDVMTFGFNYSYSKIDNMEFEYGRFFNQLEDNYASPVIILGYNTAKSLFPNNINCIGQKVQIFGKKLNVIGVTKNQGDNIINIDFDDAAIVPIKLMKQNSSKLSQSMGSNIVVKAKEGVSLETLSGELKGAMRAIRRLSPAKDDDFAINKITFLSDAIGSLFKTLHLMGLIIGLFSLLVGGFGVANIMFVSVKERTSLIGIQKALGAKNIYILLQYLSEAIVLCIIGGIIGLILTFLVSSFFNWFLAHQLDSQFRLIMNLRNVLYGVIFSAIVGLIAGIFPARQAANMLPVEAIRSK